MTLFVYDIYSGYLEDTINVIGGRDKTLLERYQRLGDFTQRSLGLHSALMYDWEQAIEELIMNPPKTLKARSQCVAMLMLLSDAAQRRFRIITEERNDAVMLPFFSHLSHDSYNQDFIRSKICDYESPIEDIQWGFLDVNQCKNLLMNIFGDDSFMMRKTAAIAGRLSQMSRKEAEQALLEVGIETQGSISNKIDYLIVGSKGTTGAKHQKAQNLNDKGQTIQVLDEAGFDGLLCSPKPPPSDWTASDKFNFEEFVRSLRHVWACDLDLYCLSFVYEPEVNII